MSGPSSSRDADNSGTWPSSSAAFNVNAGRNAFRTMDPDDSENPDMLRRQQFVMRSFTQSIEMDLPPAPELPPDLDIDRYNFDDTEQPAREPGSRLTSSSTADTIVEVKSRHHHDAKLGETQKYVMTVPEPGHTEQEMEMHASLMRAESGDESDPELAAAAASTAAAARKSSGPPVAGSRHESTHHDPLRREFSNSVMQRPRPTTPTSLSTLEAYAAEQEVAPTPTDAKEKIKVVIPKKAIKSRQPEDFYHSMASQMPPQCRGRAPDSQPDVDIIENNPDYRDKAPPTPVVHRRSSVEWEAFEESKTDWSAASMADDEEAGAQKPNGTAEQVKPETAAAFAEELFGNDEWATEPPAVRENEPDEQEPIPPADVTESKKTPADEGESAVDATEVDAKAAELAHEAVEATTTKAPSEAKQEHPIPTWDLPDQDQEPTDEPTWGDPPVPVTSVEGDQPASTDDANPTVTDFEANAEAAETYDPSQYYDYSAYGYDANYYANYGQEGAPVEGTAPAEGYDQSAYAGYDPAAYAGYDATTGSYDTSGAYDYSQYGAYDPSAAGYDSSAAAYANYDASVAGYSYDPSDPAYAMPTAVDPNAADYNAYQTEGYAEGYDYSAAAVAESTEYPPTVAAATHDYPIQDPDAQPHDYSKLAEIVATEEHKLAETADADVVAPAAAEQPAYDSAAYYDTAQYEDYSKYGYPAAIDTETTQHHFVEPLPPLTGTEPDPYSWEAQTSDYSAPAAAEPVPAPEPEPAETKVVEEAEAPVAKVPPPRPAPAKPPPPRPAAPQPARPPPPSASASAAPPPPPPPKKQESEEEDAWAKFNKLSAQVTSAVKSTEEKIKELGETTAANEIHDESYVSSVGGSQGMMTPAVLRQMQQVEEEKKKAKADKKKAKKLKRPQSPELDPNREMDMDRAAAELVAKLAKTRAHDIGDWRPPGSEDPVVVPKEPASPSSSEEDLPVPAAPSEPEPEPEPTEPEPTEESSPEPPPIPSNWAGFDETEQQRVQAELPPSDSDFFSIHLKGAPPVTDDDPFAPPKPLDPFAVSNGGDAFDPFDIRSAEDIVAQAKERANLIAAQEDLNADVLPRLSSGISTPTPEGGSPVSPRPAGFEDEFQMEGSDFASPLYDEDDSAPLEVFPKPFTGDGWELMIRYPPKKKIMGDRYWKACYVKIQGNMLYILNSKTDPRPMQEIMLQPTYSLSDNTLQAYDVYGKIHTIKLQHVQYKERVGIRAGQISRLVEGHVTKYGLPIEHAAQITVLAKFGSLNADEFNSFVNVIEDFLFNAPIKREVAPVYKQDEVQIHCYDEYQAHVDKNGFVSNQLARVRMFCLAFVTGSPFLEIGLNDRRRQGKEIVRRKDILPMYTERWIRFENLDFHSTIDKKAFEEEQLLKLSPPDGVFFEMCRFRIRPPKNKEKPLQIKSVMKIAGSKIEIRINAMAAAQTQRARGTVESIRTIPCEDIVIKFPIPEAWIYIFREERHWGVGSVHSKMRKPGKVKNLKDRIMGAVQTSEATLIEVAAGEAKYEHVYRSLVWRIPRLPVRDAAAYKDYMLKCRFDLSSFDLMPEVFMPNCDVDFTMPLATVSHTVVRSVSVEQHEDSDRVEKYVRYVAKCKYDVEIDYVQCNDLDNDVIFDPTVANPEAAMAVQPEQHKALFDPDQVAQQHGDYGIEFSETEFGGASRKRNDSSSDEEPEKRPIPIIEIDMKGYGY